MRVALIYPHYGHKVFNENLSLVDREFGRFPYISYGYVARCIKEWGGDVRLFDAMATGIGYEETFRRVKEYNPDLLGFAAHSAQTLPDTIAWAKRMKADSGLPILVGGYEAGRYSAEIMHHSCFDYLCTGQAQGFMSPFLDAFQKRGDFKSVPGLVYRSGENVVSSSVPAGRIAFNDFGVPDRSIFDHSAYYSHVSQRRNFTIGVSSHGCPYGCSFCCMANTGHDAKSAEQVFAEIQDCYQNYNIREIDWFDPLMFLQKRRIVDICERIQAAKMDLYWSARTRADTLIDSASGQIDEKFIETLASSGCKRLFIGIESGDQDVLQNINKGLRTRDLHKLFSSLRAHGIRVLGFFMIGNPGETAATVRKTVALAKSLPIDYAQFSITLMKPDTQLSAQYMVPAIGFDYWREFIKGTVVERVLPSPWTRLRREEQERMAYWAYVSFYFRPTMIARSLRRVESFAELGKYARVAAKILMRYIVGFFKRTN
ncbi:MAG: hypothetical protein A2X94_07945 [Bdellovibrionales bacterium GWB1_55_8]|nr:MAG: hypothetical protein A2X94_07945 [Bdellovibrionales bacterium GWB1_55_8]